MINYQKKYFSIFDCVNGIYMFPQKDEKLEQNMKEYEFLDLSDCYCMDDLVSKILDNEINEFVIVCTKDVLVLARELCNNLHEIDKDLKIIWLISELDKAYNCKLDNYSVEILPELLLNDTREDIIFDDFIKICPQSTKMNKEVYAEIKTNEFTLMMTGKYPNSYIYSKPKHVYVMDKHILDKEKLYNKMDLNSDIFLQFSEYDEEEYKGWKKRYYNHINYVSKDKLYLDGKSEELEWSLENYAESIEKKDDEGLKYLNLSSQNDLDSLMKDMNYFSETGRIPNYRFYLVNECRWANRCSLLYQKRLILHKDESISICGGSKPLPYSLQEDEYEQFTSREKLIEQAQIKHKCKKCEVNKWCTKCAYSPEEFSDSMFCEIMKEHIEIQDFINIKNVLLMLKRYADKNSSFNLSEMSFSNYYHNLLLPEGMKGKKPILYNAYLFEYSNKYYYFNPIKGKIFHIGFCLAFVLEAVQKGYSYDETWKSFNEKWNEKYQEEAFKCAWDKVCNSIIH